MCFGRLSALPALKVEVDMVKGWIGKVTAPVEGDSYQGLGLRST